jgi:putative DNA primase/helicase
MSLLTRAKAYHDAGYAVMPLRLDGSKATRIKWRKYEFFELAYHFNSIGNPSGIGILCGQLSGGLEVLDFDEPSMYPQWVKLIEKVILDGLPIIETPSDGRHIWWRYNAVEPNQVLARDEKGGILIETRGQGGMVVAVGSPWKCIRYRSPTAC